MSEARRSLDRIERLVEIRETYVNAAEASVKEAEGIVRYFKEDLAANARQIQQAREDIAYLKSLTGHDIQTREKHILSLGMRARQIAQDLEKAEELLETRRAEWRETMKEKRIVERVQERRMQEWRRSVDAMEQVQADEMNVVRHVRDKSHSASESDRSAHGRARSGEAGGTFN